MRLFELINFDPVDSKHNNDSYNAKLAARTSAKPTGEKGTFGQVYTSDSSKRLNQVTKIGRASNFGDASDGATNIKQDGYLSYLYRVHEFEKSGKRNPYFPIVYDLKIMRDKDGKLTYRTNSQKFIDYKNEAILGNKDLTKSIYKGMFVDDSEGTYDIMASLQRCLYRPEIIKDPKLAEAIDLIRTVIKGNSAFFYDMHPDNAMWYVTGTRPQLVLTDPVA